MPRHVAHAQFTSRAATKRDSFDLNEVGGAALHELDVPAKAGVNLPGQTMTPSACVFHTHRHKKLTLALRPY